MKTLILIFILSLIIIPFLCLGNDTITHNTPLTNNQTIVSNGDVFELGFFNLSNDNWFIGIWYKQIVPKTYVWVANRDTPITSLFGVLNVAEKGNIVLLDQAETVVSAWSSNVSFPEGNKTEITVAQLLDSGNFVLRWENDENPENYIWQSFDHPTDTLLPDMKLGWDGKTGVNRFLQSWKTNTDPGSGDYSFKMDPNGFPEFFVIKNKTVVTYRSGAWNGRRFSGTPEVKNPSLIQFEYQNNFNEISYYSFNMLNTSVYSRVLMSSSGYIQRFMWVETSSAWTEYYFLPRDQCDNYLECGPYGICDSKASPVCTCMKGFRPKNQQAWDLRDGSHGCVRSSKLDCGSDGFSLLKNIKLPKSSNVFVDKAMSLSECGEICKRNCSCAAYANMDITRNGSGCVIWEVDLLDMRESADYDGGGQDLYVRVAASDLDTLSTARTFEKGSGNNHVVTIVSFSISGFVVAVILLILFYLRRRKTRRLKKMMRHKKVILPTKNDYYGETKMDELELPSFDFSTMAMATDNFSDANKLGEGGFGYVYKGILTEGEVVAVKRLSKVSDQGIEELNNEVRLIAKLQHKNLVRLLGCCIEVEEKLLIYEFMENKSLDTFLFEKEKSLKLSWQMRLDIILGITRGLLYLHQDSRFKIIHRDLKASNVLLDKVMNPKISDFGMARIFGSEQIEAKTKKVVGTYGYMSPEYAMNGHFSTKSDVFSFGVLVLEIVSGKKNTRSSYTSSQLSLLGYSWKLWQEGNTLELADKSMGDRFSSNEVLRCVQIGLLCVQENPEDRPSMAKVLLMLSTESVQLPEPKYHGYFVGERRTKAEPLNKHDESMTVNEVTLTLLDAR